MNSALCLLAQLSRRTAITTSEYNCAGDGAGDGRDDNGYGDELLMVMVVVTVIKAMLMMMSSVERSLVTDTLKQILPCNCYCRHCNHCTN